MEGWLEINEVDTHRQKRFFDRPGFYECRGEGVYTSRVGIFMLGVCRLDLAKLAMV